MSDPPIDHVASDEEVFTALVLSPMQPVGEPFWITTQHQPADHVGQHLYIPTEHRVLRVLEMEPFREGVGWRYKVTNVERPPAT